MGTGALLLVWITLFSILFRFTPRLGSPRRQRPAIPLAPARRSPAVRNRMLSVMGPRATELTTREQEMVDWGFAFGVAWAVARREDPEAPEAVVSERALHAARAAAKLDIEPSGTPLKAAPGLPMTAPCTGSDSRHAGQA